MLAVPAAADSVLAGAEEELLSGLPYWATARPKGSRVTRERKVFFIVKRFRRILALVSWGVYRSRNLDGLDWQETQDSSGFYSSLYHPS